MAWEETSSLPGTGPAPEPVCRAPFVAMEFDPFGDVQACCANALFPLGNVGRSSLREIWEGPRAQALRDALANHDLSLGCSVCRYRLVNGHGELPLEYYNNFPMPGDDVRWPYSLQFSLHNTCNLACVMCGADRSSKIRTQRSGLAPLPHAYGDAFFSQIEPFLAHAGAVDFSGGEPFLIAEHGRIWDLLIAMDERPLCSLTTNGTVWNERTERVLAELDTHISVSVDGMTAETFEAIRVGARFTEVMANLDRFLDYTNERGTVLTMSWSLVRANWHELGAAARFAESRGIHLKVQTVIEPEFGLQRLPTSELTEVVRALQAEGEVLEAELVLNRDMWRREVRRLEEELEHRATGGLRGLCMEPAGPENVDHVVAMMLDSTERLVPVGERDDVVARSTADLQRWCSTDRVARFDLDARGAVVDGSLGALAEGVLADIDGAAVVDVASILRSFEEVLGGQLWIGEEWAEHDRLVHILWIGRAVRDKVGLVIECVTVADDAGTTLLMAVDATLLGAAGPEAVAVSLGPRRSVAPGVEVD